MQPRLFLLLGVALVAVSTTAKKLPDYIQKCHRSDPKFDACMISSIESLRTRLGRGIPQLQVPGYEPLVIPALHIDRNNEALEVSATLENLKVAGGSKFIINDLKTNFDGLGLKAKITLPELQVVTDYDVNGRLLVVPLTGKGVLEGTFKQVTADLQVTGKFTERKNKKYLVIDNFKSDVKVGDSKLKFLTPSGQAQKQTSITSASTQFINGNKDQVLELIKPIIEDTVNELFTGIANRVLQSVPYDDLVPE
ncbi:Hypothetical predicted protein [Cloeon dipterum]|uniref:Hemolymph juvenile hormone binding protein n=1 Tax=Cloeon dipterum TaxID=197152 RepID=A0A8S1BUW9_9INSE|nr:Hypothetical predicted protein [Cloeon dipterum]